MKVAQIWGTQSGDRITEGQTPKENPPLIPCLWGEHSAITFPASPRMIGGNPSRTISPQIKRTFDPVSAIPCQLFFPHFVIRFVHELPNESPVQTNVRLIFISLEKSCCHCPVPAYAWPCNEKHTFTYGTLQASLGLHCSESIPLCFLCWRDLARV